MTHNQNRPKYKKSLASDPVFMSWDVPCQLSCNATIWPIRKFISTQERQEIWSEIKGLQFWQHLFPSFGVNKPISRLIVFAATAAVEGNPSNYGKENEGNSLRLTPD